MATSPTRRIPNETLLADREILVKLQTLPDYQPTSEAMSIANLQRIAAELDRAEEAEVLARRALAVARERLVEARATFHNAILSAKLQVVVQYGDDSPIVHAVGLKQKSERRRPVRRVPTA